MLIRRRELSAMLLAVVALLFYMLFLFSAQSRAQTNANDCPGAQTVNTTTGTGDKQSSIFNISGTSFRITTTIQATSSDPSLASVSAIVKRAGGETVTTFDKNGPGTDSSIINAGPGPFFLDILAANSNYTITVEDCTGTSQGGGINQITQNQLQPNIVQPNIVQPNVVQPTNIVNIPKKKLPPSGGSPVYGVVAIFILVGLGLSALGWGIQRSLRRRI